MKKIFLLTALAVLLGVATATAQQIAVVAEDGETTVFQTLPDAIDGADPGSVIYLPGGGFTISDDVKITKRLTIIGIGHKSTNDNVDGATIISGNVFFNGGSEGSAIMGCYVTGKICIGHDDTAVNNILVKCCNVNAIDSHANSFNTVVSQNYMRNNSAIRGVNSIINNNIMHSLREVYSSMISNNIITYYDITDYYCAFSMIYDSNIYNNIFLEPYNVPAGTNCQINNNMFSVSSSINYGDNCIHAPVYWNELFVDYNGGAINPRSNFHFKEDYQQYESQVGVYVDGVDFDKQIAPVPYIVAKKIDEQTDASGHLGIKVRVKAGD